MKAGSTTWQWVCEETFSGERLDRAIAAALEAGLGTWEGERANCSRTMVRNLLQEGRIRIDEATAKPSAKLKAGARVRIDFPPPAPLELIPEERPLDILYEDEHLLVLNKPPGLTVHPSSTQAQGTLVHALLHHVRDLSGIGGVLRPGIVHRIDKDTSGALVITKTEAAHHGLVASFAKHDIRRVYWAACYGTPGRKTGASPVRIESLIGRNPSDRKKMSMKVKQGRNAITYYQVTEEYAEKGRKPFASFLHVTLETGRTHQIRVHLTGIGHSILADPVYGTPTEKQPKWLALPADVREATKALPGQALHARVLGFKHPVTGKELYFEAELPEAYQKLLSALRNHSS